MKNKEVDNKKVKKIIVNGLTLSRVAGMFAMPFLVNVLSAPMFILVVATILFTDFVDGALARHWDVSTIFGSLADMGADKLFGMSILVVLASMYPIMYLALGLEIGILSVNTFSAKRGNISKSSELGRIKTVIVGLSICALLLTGLSPELVKSLESVKLTDNKIINDIINMSKNFVNSIIYNKNVIESVSKTAAITSETLVLSDYAIKSIKKPNKGSQTYKISEYLKNKEFRDYIKKVLFDVEYYKKTKDMPILEKLTPPEYRIDNVKKLTLDKK